MQYDAKALFEGWKGKCAQCGKPPTSATVRTFGPPSAERMVRTEWCQTHEPSVWQLVARDRKKAQKAWDRAEWASLRG